MVMVPPASGHMNPMCGIVHELCKDPSLDVMMYSDESFRRQVEATGAKFRRYSHLTFSKLPELLMKTQANRFFVLLDELITFSYDLLPQLIRDVEGEQPDLIIYDCFFIPAKHLLNIFKRRSSTNKQYVPKSLMYYPNFAINDKVGEMFQENAQSDFWTPFWLIKLFFRQVWFNWSYGLSSYNPFGPFMERHDKLSIVGVIPELQPFRDEFDQTYKFIGSCVCEEARNYEFLGDDDELKKFLDKSDKSTRLIYMSLGTVFNSNFYIFERAIEAIIDLFENRKHQIRLIMSVGHLCMNKFAEKSDSLPANVLVRQRVAQLEVLKRADLFITHCGMNSVNEAIKYAVPMVGIPIEGDQPVVARRVCQELELGIRLNAHRLTGHELANAIDRVLSEPKYTQNVQEISRVSAKYNGQVEGAKVIMDYLSQKGETAKKVE